jgi:hypothetical protein
MTATTSIARSRTAPWLKGALLATALAGAAALLPANRAEAADVQVRVDLGMADVIFRSGHPYHYYEGSYYPVYVEYDHWHHPHYYRYAPRPVVYRPVPPPHHHHTPPPHYRVSYDDRHRGHDRHGRDDHHGKKGRGHDGRHGGRGWDD